MTDDDFRNLEDTGARQDGKFDLLVKRIEALETSQKAELESRSDQIRALKEQNCREIEALKEDVRTLVELIWCVVHRVTNEKLVHGIDPGHAGMAHGLADKYGVVSKGIQKI